MKVQDVHTQVSDLKSNHDVTNYNQFKAYFQSHLHHNILLSILQKSILLQVIHNEDVRDRIGPRTVSDSSSYKIMLRKLEDMYGCNLEAGYMRKCHELPMLDPMKPETWDKIAKVVSAAEAVF